MQPHRWILGPKFGKGAALDLEEVMARVAGPNGPFLRGKDDPKGPIGCFQVKEAS